VKDEAAKAAELLNQLPSSQQQVIKLSIYDGLSHSKIAEAPGLSLGTVKTNIRRGMLKLRKSLFPEHELRVSESILKGEVPS
jgi:RNA polymerase sigma-70 factor (ECF subfamily)